MLQFILPISRLIQRRQLNRFGAVAFDLDQHRFNKSQAPSSPA